MQRHHDGTGTHVVEAHCDPEAEEPREICRDTLAEARRLGVAVPRLEAAEPNFARDSNG